MKLFEFPAKQDWPTLCQRAESTGEIDSTLIACIFKKVREEGDETLRFYSEKWDGARPKSIACEIGKLQRSSDQNLLAAIKQAAYQIRAFHAAQNREETVVESTSGVRCWRRAIPIERVGLYIPGGSAPLLSTLLMLGIPAQLAGCRELVICTPLNKNRKVDESIVAVAQFLGIEKIYTVGGAQAIAAMTYGTESIPKVDKIFGPGNAFVTAAKQFAQSEGMAIDMPAGPSEVLVIAGEMANPAFVAADLLSQAEHGPDSQVLLLSDSQQLIAKVEKEIENQLSTLPRKAIVKEALENSRSILLENLKACMEFSNTYAPEHLIINTQNADELAEMVSNAGSVFIGEWSCESAGDYASGTNHTLPTYGFARSYSGVSLDSFYKQVTFQSLSKTGLENLAQTITTLARAEQLEAHARAVDVRLKSLKL